MNTKSATQAERKAKSFEMKTANILSSMGEQLWESASA